MIRTIEDLIVQLNKLPMDAKILIGDDDGEMGVFYINNIEYDHDFHVFVINFNTSERPPDT